MALLLRDIALDIPVDESCLPVVVAELLGLDVSSISDFQIVRSSVDARKKSRIRRVYTLCFNCDREDDILAGDHGLRLEKASPPPEIEQLEMTSPHHALVVGMGPAGLFAAKRLVEAGAQVTLIDRGKPVEQRIKDVEAFWKNAELKPDSNVQYGEGGAGTFSDGKLTTRLNHPLRHHLLKTLVDFGAPENILFDAKPHIGTDRLRKVVIRFRNYLENQGVNLLFDSCLTGLEVSGGRIHGGIINSTELVICDSLVLAPGHSARDTYQMLERSGVRLVPKGFAVGVRVEHPAELINQIQYGSFADQLPTADYSLRYNDEKTGRGVYSFCMCPGGEVVNAASESDGLVVNGMSRMARSSSYSNSALVVGVTPEDWSSTSLGGVEFQKKWEQLAFRAGGGQFKAPAQNLLDFAGAGKGPVSSSCRPGVVESELREVLPEFVYHGLRKALPHFERKMRGFMTSEAVLVGVETRTSAPVRILRNDAGESVSHKGLFPTGEGAGYAGGIMSSAYDGLRAAEKVIQSYSQRVL